MKYRYLFAECREPSSKSLTRMGHSEEQTPQEDHDHLTGVPIHFLPAAIVAAFSRRALLEILH